jgi:hypothetical protein
LKASNEISKAKPTDADRLGSADSSSSTDERFSLTGPSLPLDERIHAYRRDIADIALAGQIIAPHYARPVMRSCGPKPALVRRQPADGPIASELLPGEDFAVLEYSGGWAWGYCRADHYVGYVEAIELVQASEPTHIVCEASAPIFPDGKLGSLELARLPMGSRITGEECGPCLTTEIGCVPLSYLRRAGERDDDAALVAERLLGAPYLEGGRSYHGIDAAGLVQVALALCGLPAPRQARQQQSIGEPLPQGSRLKRGDLVFMGDHVAMMIDDLMAIHASPQAGKVVVEPLALVEGERELLERRRPSF